MRSQMGWWRGGELLGYQRTERIPTWRKEQVARKPVWEALEDGRGYKDGCSALAPLLGAPAAANLSRVGE